MGRTSREGKRLPFYDANLDMQASSRLVEAYQRAKGIRTVLQESLIPVSRPGPVGAIPSVDDLNPLRPSAGLHSFASRHQDLKGEKEKELRRITILQCQIKQASINVNRLKRDLQFLDRQVLAAQHQSRDCDLPQTTRGVDREAFSYLPYAGVDDEESAPIGTTATAGSTLKGSMMEDDDTD